MADEGFFSRWSRRKIGSTQNKEAPPAVTKDEPVTPVVPLAPASPPAPLAQTSAEPMAGEAKPALTMDDVAKLTKDSDYSPFVARGVDEQVKRSALKKLFSDPHFNVMDGLDTYIEDYSKFEPIPPEMLASLNHAKALLDPLAHLEKPPMMVVDKSSAPERALTDQGEDASEPPELAAAATPEAEDDATCEEAAVPENEPAPETPRDPETNPEARP